MTQGLWQPFSTAPRDGAEIEVLPQPERWRWLPYKPKSLQFRKGIAGRWQRHTASGWESVQHEPAVWRPAHG